MTTKTAENGKVREGRSTRESSLKAARRVTDRGSAHRPKPGVGAWHVLAPSRRGVSIRSAAVRDLTGEADARHRRNGAVRGGYQALSVAVRDDGMTVMDTTKRDGDTAGV